MKYLLIFPMVLLLISPSFAQRGDLDCNNQITISDAVALINYMFNDMEFLQCDDSLKLVFRLPGIVGYPTIFEDIKVSRTQIGKQLSDWDTVWTTTDLAGTEQRFFVKTPNDGIWYKFEVGFRYKEFYMPMSSIWVMRKEEYVTFKWN